MTTETTARTAVAATIQFKGGERVVFEKSIVRPDYASPEPDSMAVEGGWVELSGVVDVEPEYGKCAWIRDSAGRIIQAILNNVSEPAPGIIRNLRVEPEPARSEPDPLPRLHSAREVAAALRAELGLSRNQVSCRQTSGGSIRVEVKAPGIRLADVSAIAKRAESIDRDGFGEPRLPASMPRRLPQHQGGLRPVQLQCLRAALLRAVLLSRAPRMLELLLRPAGLPGMRANAMAPITFSTGVPDLDSRLLIAPGRKECNVPARLIRFTEDGFVDVELLQGHGGLIRLPGSTMWLYA